MNMTGLLQIRISPKQHKQLKMLTEVHGYATVSDYVRNKLFGDLSIHMKLNKIIELLEARK